MRYIKANREKWTGMLVWLFVPLEVIPFFFENDSTVGKALLLVKLFIVALVYVLHIDVIRIEQHLILMIAVVSMTITVFLHGGVGIVALVLILLMGLVAFPVVKLKEKQIQILFTALSIGALATAGVCAAGNIFNGYTAFDINGRIHPNAFGLLFLSSYLYLRIALHYVTNNKHFNVWLFVITMLYGGLILLTGCRSAIISFVVYVTLTFVLRVWPNRRLWSITYYSLIAFSAMIWFLSLIPMVTNSLATESVNTLTFLGKPVFSGRERVWKSALSYIGASPVFGSGNQYVLTIPSIGAEFTSAHNVFLGLLLCVGALPAMSYLALLLRPNQMFSSLREQTPMPYLVPVSFAAALVVATFECSLTDAQYNFLFLLILLDSGRNHVKIMSENIN